MEIQPHEIREQTERICLSPGFRNSHILTKFLRFVVEYKLEGKENQLKEYTVGLYVLKKKPDFNPSLDAIVRIHASRLRKLLDGYYAAESFNDPIRILIPKGTYVPSFERLDSSLEFQPVEPSNRESPLKYKPVLAVLPFNNYANNPQIDIVNFVLSTDLSVELTRFSELAVISSTSSIQAAEKIENKNVLAQHLGADYLISGNTITLGNQVRVTIELYVVESNVILWADSFIMDDEENDIFSNVAYIIRKVVGVITGHFGIIYRYLLQSHSASITKDYSYAIAIYMYHQYHMKFTMDSMVEAIKALEAAHVRHPENALISCILGGVYLNLSTVGFTGEFDPVELGMKYLNISIKTDPNLPDSYKSLSWANILNHDKNSFIQHINKAVSINPNNVTITGDAGFGHICVGEYEKGLEYLLAAVNLNPYYPWYFNLGFSLYYFHQKDFEEALFFANKVNRHDYFLDPVLKISALGWLGRSNDAVPLIREILTLSPDFPQKAKEMIGIFLLDQELIQTILTGLIKAGFRVVLTDDTDEDKKIINISRARNRPSSETLR